jgi:hypothetical protein
VLQNTRQSGLVLQSTSQAGQVLQNTCQAVLVLQSTRKAGLVLQSTRKAGLVLQSTRWTVSREELQSNSLNWEQVLSSALVMGPELVPQMCTRNPQYPAPTVPGSL